MGSKYQTTWTQRLPVHPRLSSRGTSSLWIQTQVIFPASINSLLYKLEGYEQCLLLISTTYTIIFPSSLINAMVSFTNCQLQIKKEHMKSIISNILNPLRVFYSSRKLSMKMFEEWFTERSLGSGTLDNWDSQISTNKDIPWTCHLKQGLVLLFGLLIVTYFIYLPPFETLNE